MKAAPFKYFLCFTIWIFSFTISKGQYKALSDSCFKNALYVSQPSFFNADTLLDTVKALNYYGEVKLVNSCVEDLSEIIYFRNITSLSLNDNQITDVSPLSDLWNLSYLMINNNEISDFSQFYQLDKLIHLEVSYNNIGSIQSPENPWNIKNVYLTGSSISAIESFNNFPELEYLVLSHNPLTGLPPLDSLKKLRELHINNTEIDRLEGFVSENFTRIYTHYTKVSNLSFLDSCTTLEYLIAHHCQITTLPYIDNKMLVNVQLGDNKLTFSDLFPLTKQIDFENFTYSPQANFFVSNNLSLRVKDILRLESNVDVGLSNTNHMWYREGQFIDAANFLSINNVSSSDTGLYYLKITNNQLEGLELHSFPWNLEVSPCIEIENLNYDVVESDCEEGSTIEFGQLKVRSNNPPFKYSLFHNNTLVNENPTPYFEKLHTGKYTLQVTDNAACSAMEEFMMIDNSECVNVFSPNGDGEFDEFYIQTSGSSEILNSKGEKVKNLETPAFWDGTDNSGQKVKPGYYLIRTNGGNYTGVNVMH